MISDAHFLVTSKHITCPNCGGHTFQYEREDSTNRILVSCRSNDKCKFKSNFNKPWACLWEPSEISGAHEMEERLRIHKEKFGKQTVDSNARAS